MSENTVPSPLLNFNLIEAKQAAWVETWGDLRLFVWAERAVLHGKDLVSLLGIEIRANKARYEIPAWKVAIR